MDASFWHTKWERAEIGFHKETFDLHLQQQWNRLGLGKSQRVFVPLCGKSLDMLWLAGEGHPVTGVELSPLAVEAFFEENNLLPRRYQQGSFNVWEADEIRIMNGNIFDLEARHIADCAGVYERASLIALPPTMREEYVRHLSMILPPVILILLVTMEYDQTVRSGPPFSVSEEEVMSLYNPAFEVEKLYTHDALSKESPFRAQGLRELHEKGYLLSRRSTQSSLNS